MNINEYLIQCERTHGGVAKRITCNDGFEMSVQASEYTYCTPRTSVGPWHQVEVGFPSDREESLMPYAEDTDRPTETVYGYVPVDVVDAIIESHGGIA